jgi:diguanylate cyclase (GGDEF)-like protein/PAS domain S-box-containing protein
MAERLPVGVCMVAGEHLLLNRVAEKLTGYSRGELPTVAAWFQTLYGDQADEFQALYARDRADGADSMSVVPLFCKSGAVRYVELAAYRWDGGEIWLLYDVTERQQAQAAARLAQERLEESQRIARIGSWEFDVFTEEFLWSKETFRILELNPAVDTLYYELFTLRFHPDDVPMHNAIFEQAIEDGLPFEFDVRLLYSNGSQGWARTRGKGVRDRTGKVVRLIGTLMDITDRKCLDERLTTLSVTDALTGLNNHRAFQEQLAEEFERTQRYSTPLSLVIMDMDQFKSFNDSFGYTEGDQMLKRVAGILQKVARNTDIVCRFGGEEFGVILPNTAAEGAVEAAERFRSALEAQTWPFRAMSASFGASTAHADMTTVQQLITEAEQALHASKRQGRNRVTHSANLYWTPQVDALAHTVRHPLGGADSDLKRRT